MRPLFTLFAAVASASVLASPPVGEPLFFALEVKQDGRVVGTPKLLGEEGKPVRVEKRAPGATEPEFKLVLLPSQVGDHYELALDVTVPGMQRHYDLQLLHGEVRKVAVQEGHPGQDSPPLEVELLVLRVDSPEFRALMNLDAPEQARPSI